MTPAPRRPPPSSPVGTERSVYEETDPAVVMKRCRSTRTERRRLMCREHGRQHQYRHGDQAWTQHFGALVLDDETLRAELALSGLRIERMLDPGGTWVLATP